MSAQEKLAAMRRVMRWEGATGLLRRAATRLLSPVLRFTFVFFFAEDLTRRAPATPVFPEGVEAVVVEGAGIAAYRATLEQAFGRPARLLDERLARGHAVALALHAGQPISMLWLAFGEQRVDELGATLHLREGDVVSYDARTAPEWRGQGISPALSLVAEQHAITRSARRHITWRNAHNTQALRVAAKLQQRRVAVVARIWIVGWSVRWVVDRTPDAWLSFS